MSIALTNRVKQLEREVAELRLAIDALTKPAEPAKRTLSLAKPNTSKANG